MKRKNKSIKKLKPFLFTFITLIWMGSLMLNNYSNHQTLLRNDLNNDINILEDTTRMLNAKISELQTIERIEKESTRLNLVKVQAKEIQHLGDSDKVALR